MSELNCGWRALALLSELETVTSLLSTVEGFLLEFGCIDLLTFFGFTIGHTHESPLRISVGFGHTPLNKWPACVVFHRRLVYTQRHDGHP
jgi:hypothetical protein